MIDRESLFREEALEFQARGRETPGTLVRLGAPWIRWSYRLALVLVVIGVLLSLLLRTTTTTTGAALVNGEDGTFSALIPAAVAPQLTGSEEIRIELDTPGNPTLSARATDAQPVSPNARVGGLPRTPEPAILLTGRVVGADAENAAVPSRRGLPARATIVLGSKRVGVLVLDQLGGMFRAPGGGA